MSRFIPSRGTLRIPVPRHHKHYVSLGHFRLLGGGVVYPGRPLGLVTTLSKSIATGIVTRGISSMKPRPSKNIRDCFGV